MEHLVRMLPMMMASRSVQVPDSQSGMRIPAEGEESGAAGLNRSGQHPATEPLLPTQDAFDLGKQRLLRQPSSQRPQFAGQDQDQTQDRS